jgi:hypothetical protein
MSYCRIRFVPLLLLAAVLTSASASGQTDNPHAAVSKYLDSSTTVVGWVDITQIDVDRLSEFIHQVSGSRLQPQQPVTPVQEALVQLGVTRIYWVTDMTGLPQGPESLIVPAEKPQPVALILKSLIADTRQQVLVEDQAVLVGSQDWLDGMKNRKGNPAEELTGALNLNSDPHGIVVCTPLHALMPVVSILPRFAEGDSKLQASATEALISLKSISVSGQLPPSESTLRISTKSADTANQLADLVNTWVADRAGDKAAAVKLTAKDNDVLLKTGSLEETVAAIKVLGSLQTGSDWSATTNSLKQIALAMHNFHANHGHFAPQSLVDDNGKRLLSWRVLLLPYLDAYPLYQEFHLDEPWDSEHNKTLIAKMPAVFQSRGLGVEVLESGRTRFVAPLTADSAMGRSGPGVPIRDIIDGTSNTLLVVRADADRAVIWTKPDDVVIADESNPIRSLIGEDSKGFSACLCDGSCRFFSASIPPELLRALLSINGREVIDWDKVE